MSPVLIPIPIRTRTTSTTSKGLRGVQSAHSWHGKYSYDHHFNRHLNHVAVAVVPSAVAGRTPISRFGWSEVA